MSFIKKVQEKRNKKFDDKEKVLLKIKEEIEFSASLGYSKKDLRPRHLEIMMSSLLDKDIEPKEFNDLLGYTLMSLKGEGFKVSLEIPEKSDQSLMYVIAW